MRIGVCIRAKDEQKIIGDWVIHYTDLGFDKIVIYDNLSNPSIEETLKSKDLLNNKIEIKIDENPYSNQGGVYQECLDENKDLDWLLLCDADEFLWIKHGNIKLFLEQFSNDTSTLLINWLVFGTSNLQQYNMLEPIFKQFILREDYTHFWNSFVKSIVRPKLIDKIGNVHVTHNEKYHVKNVYNKKIKIIDNGKSDYVDNILSDETPLLMVHYMTLDFKSMEQKYHRNRKGALLPEDNCNKYSLEWYQDNHYGLQDKILDLRLV